MDWKYITSVFTNTSSLFIVFPIIIGLMRFRALNYQQKTVVAYLIVSFITYIVAYYSALWFRTNLWVVHIFAIIEFLLVSTLFLGEVTKIISPKTFNLIRITYVFLAIIFSFIQKFDSFNSISRTIECFLLIFCSVSFFYISLKELKVESLEKTPAFWYSTGVLIYFSGYLFLSILGNFTYILTFGAQSIIWICHAVLLFIFYILLLISIWLPAKPQHK